MEAADVPVRTTTVDVFLPEDQQDRRKLAEFEDLGTDHDVPFNLVCVNAPELPRFYAEVGPDFFAGKRTIGVWAWEVDRVPEDWAWAFGVVDEIWTYSQYVVDVLRPASNVPVARVPLPVLEPPAAGPAARPRAARQVHLPVPVRLLLDGPAQEPARPDRGLPARVSRPARARSWCSRASTATSSPSGWRRSARRPPATRTSTWWTAT